jgi:UDP-glucose 4-epimerase
VVPLFVAQTLRGEPITVTDPNMTRFVMTLPQSVDLVLHAFQNGGDGDLFVQKAPAVTVQDLAGAVLDALGKPDHPVKIMGTRHGEKLYETLLSREEMAVAHDEGRYYRVAPDKRDLNYSAFEFTGETRISEAQDYNSHNTDRLDRASMRDILLSLDYIKRVLRGESPEGDE